MLKTVRDACVVDPIVFDYKEAGGIETLVETINAQDGGIAFFDRTHMTDGLKKLLREGLMRLSGNSDQALFELTQAMGGGKSHLMSALGILAKNPALRSHYLDPEDAKAIGKDPYKIIVFDGRNNPENFLWGAIADQIGPHAQSVMKRFFKDGPRAPGKDDWIKIIGDQPILIMFDELPPYFQSMAAIPAGAGTAADVLTASLSNLFAAALELPRCCIVLANLKSSYKDQSSKVSKLVETAHKEAGRQSRKITPVDMKGDEVYAIIRKRLFKSMPSDEEITAVAEAYEQDVRKAENAGHLVASTLHSKTIKDEIVQCYPFHYSFKHIIALFKDNPDFKETRGLLQFTAALLKSVWERPTNDVYLIGTQHLDLGNHAVSTLIHGINSTLGSAISKDIFDRGHSHAEKIDHDLGVPAATEVANLILSSSLTQSVDGQRGLKEAEVIEYLISPKRSAKVVGDALKKLREACWYLHKEEDALFFKNTENLVKRIDSQAESLPPGKVDQALEVILRKVLQPRSRKAYQELLVMPKMDEIKIGTNRALLVVRPDHSVPPESVNLFFSSIEEKNQILVLTGNDWQAINTTLDGLVRRHVAISEILRRIDPSDPLVEEIEREGNRVMERLYSVLSQSFDRLYFPDLDDETGQFVLVPTTIDGGLHFSSAEGRTAEEQIEDLLRSDRCYRKLVREDKEGDEWLLPYINEAEDLLWPENQRETPWADVLRRARRNPAWAWLPGSNGMDRLKDKAVSEGRWRANNSNVEKGPFPKEKTSLVFHEVGYSEDQEKVVLSLYPRSAGPRPIVYYSSSPDVSDKSAAVRNLDHFETDLIAAYFLVVDPTGEHETGEVVTWKRKIDVKYDIDHDATHNRSITLASVPSGIDLLYTLDGTNPKDGIPYDEPIEIGDEAHTLLVYAKSGEVDVTKTFRIPANIVDEDGRPELDDSRPALLKRTMAPISLGTTEKVFQALDQLKGTDTVFRGVGIEFGEGESAFVLSAQGNEVKVADLSTQIRKIREILNKTSENVALTVYENIQFETGRCLKAFANIAQVTIEHDNFEQ